jgi:hypothetical protein
MEPVWRLQAEVLLKKCRSRPNCVPDWSVIFQILSITKSHPLTTSVYVEYLVGMLHDPELSTRLCSLTVIDAIFKHGKRDQLRLLQCPTLFQGLFDPSVWNDPELHNFLHRCAPDWLKAGRAQKCATSPLSDFCESIAETRFAAALTPAITEKLTTDLRTAAEITTVLARCLLSSGPDSSLLDNPMIAELLPDVREIGRRADVLAGQIADPILLAIIDAQRQLAHVCVRAVNEHRSRTAAPIDEITAAMAKAQKRWNKLPRRKGDDGANTEERPPPRRKSGAGTEPMTSEEFFRRLDEIKRADGGAAAHADGDREGAAALVDSLLEF